MNIILLLAALISFLIVNFTLPSFIEIARARNLYDSPNESHKIHKVKVPTLGGLVILAGYLFSVSVFLPGSFTSYNYLLASIIILFIAGLRDDLIGLSPYKKFIAQLLASFILTYLGDVRLSSMYGLFGIHEITYELSILLSMLTIVVIVNSFNLIDGIDGLAAGIGILVMGVYAVLFNLMDQPRYALIAICLAGALAGFIRFNISPTKIFMGDIGSLLIGLIASYLTIEFIELNKMAEAVNESFFIRSAPAVAVGILIIPLFDTLRMIYIRIRRSGSPFKADQDHLHHSLISIHPSHTKVVGVFLLINLAFIVKVLAMQHLGTLQLLLSVLITAIFINTILALYISNRKKNSTIMRLNTEYPEKEPVEFLKKTS